MAKTKAKSPKQSNAGDSRKVRNFPRHTLEETLVLPQKIQDEMGGKPMNRLLLAEALSLSPSSSNFRDLLSSSYKYGLTEGTEKADNISLTSTGSASTQNLDQTARLRALRNAALTPSVFGRVFRDYANKKLPSPEMLPKILSTQYQVPSDLTRECGSHIAANGRFVDIIRDIGGSPHILLDVDSSSPQTETNDSSEIDAVELRTSLVSAAESVVSPDPEPPRPAVTTPSSPAPKPIFVGHGKNKEPLQQLQRLLSTFQIPHKIVVDEANLGRPIPFKGEANNRGMRISDSHIYER